MDPFVRKFVVEVRKEPLWTVIPDVLHHVVAFAKRVGFEVWRESDGLVTLRYGSDY